MLNGSSLFLTSLTLFLTRCTVSAQPYEFCITTKSKKLIFRKNCLDLLYPDGCRLADELIPNWTKTTDENNTKCALWKDTSYRHLSKHDHDRNCKQLRTKNQVIRIPSCIVLDDNNGEKIHQCYKDCPDVFDKNMCLIKQDLEWCMAALPKQCPKLMPEGLVLPTKIKNGTRCVEWKAVEHGVYNKHLPGNQYSPFAFNDEKNTTIQTGGPWCYTDIKSNPAQWGFCFDFCRGIRCPALPSIDRPDLQLAEPPYAPQYTERTPGATVIVSCREGYQGKEWKAQKTLLTCGYAGTWENTPGSSSCPMQCEKLEANTTLFALSNSSEDIRFFDKDEELEYRCMEGNYLPGKNSKMKIKCISDEETASNMVKWDGIPHCEAACIKLVDPRNGIWKTTNVSEGRLVKRGTIATYSCNTGFKLIGSRTRECMQNGNWSCKQPSCSKMCAKPTATLLENAKIVSDFSEYYEAGSNIEYSCIGNAIPVAKTRKPDSVCNPSEDAGQKSEWNPPPQCEPACEQLPFLHNGNVEYSTNMTERLYPKATVAQFVCNNRFHVEGPTSVVCEKNGSWNETSPVCMKQCDAPRNFSTVLPQKEFLGLETGKNLFNIGAKVRYKCVKNHVPEQTDNMVAVCEKGRDNTEAGWSEVSVCRPMCSYEGRTNATPVNTSHCNADKFCQTGIQIPFECTKNGSIMIGMQEKWPICLASTSQWSVALPQCAARCSYANLTNAQPTEDEQTDCDMVNKMCAPGAEVRFRCEEGFLLTPAESYEHELPVCQAGIGKWSTTLPHCEPKEQEYQEYEHWGENGHTDAPPPQESEKLDPKIFAYIFASILALLMIALLMYAAVKREKPGKRRSGLSTSSDDPASCTTPSPTTTTGKRHQSSIKTSRVSVASKPMVKVGSPQVSRARSSKSESKEAQKHEQAQSEPDQTKKIMTGTTTEEPRSQSTRLPTSAYENVWKWKT